MIESAPQVTESNGTEPRRRAPRTHLAESAIVVEGTLPLSQVPESPRGRIGKRRWEDLASQIIEAAKRTDRDARGEAVVVTLAAGARADIVRAGVGEELKRQGYSSQTRSMTREDGGTTLYLFAVPAHA